MTYEEFTKQLWEEVDKSPKSWRKGQAVFNVIDEKWHVARDVQFIDGVDCFYDDKQIDLFIAKAWIYIWTNQELKVEMNKFMKENTGIYVDKDTAIFIAEHFINWYQAVLINKYIRCGARGRMGGVPEDISKRAESFQKTMDPPYDAMDICTAYEKGAMDQEKKLIDEGMHCKVFWYDGPQLDYTMEQQIDAIQKIDADIDDEVSVIIKKL